MKMKKWGIVAVAGALVASLALFGCSSNSGADDKKAEEPKATETSMLMTDGKLVVATSPDFPPFENLEGDEYVGFDIDLAKALAEQLGVEVEFKTLQFDAILPAVAAGGQCDVGISGITVDPERQKTTDFSDAYYIDDQAIAVMKDGAITSENADEALNQEGVIIAVQSGTTGETYVKENYPNATVQPYGNSTDAFAAMQAGQATAVCTNKAVVEQMLAQAYQDAVVVKKVATGEEYAVSVSKDNPELLAAVNEALAALKADGTIDNLVAKHLG